MRRFVRLLSIPFFSATFVLIIPLTGCKSKSDALTPPTPPSAPSAAKPNATPTVPPQVQIGPPK